MKPLEEQDQLNLDALLDGQLPAPEAEALRREAAHWPELAEALAAGERQRALCAAVFDANEPSEAEAEAFAGRVMAQLRTPKVQPIRELARVARESETRGSLIMVLRSQWLRWGVAAAACVVCFITGWQFRPQPGPVKSTPQVAVDPRVQTVYQVSLTDDQGNVKAVQRFSSLSDAQNFATEVEHWQHNQQQVRDGHAAVVAEKF